MALSAAARSELVRDRFPFFGRLSNPVFMENAGGSQCPSVVVDAIAAYMRDCYVQLGAGYELSNRATSIVSSAHEFMKAFVNASACGEVIFGSSTSTLLSTLGRSYSRILSPGDEIVVQEQSHEANLAPWMELGFKTKLWRINCDSFESELDALAQLLSPRTRIVAVSHVSNLLGAVLELDKVVELVKNKTGGRARVVVDGVAFAPHRAIDVSSWGVDWYVFSMYKVYGPHCAVLYGRLEALEEDFGGEQGPNFYFVPRNDHRYKFELGGVQHESCAGVLALWDYLKFLATLQEGTKDELSRDEFSFQVIEAAFRVITSLEEPLQRRLLEYLESKQESVQVVGPLSFDIRSRVPTISFVHKTKTSKEIATQAQKAGFAIRHGHMYAHRLVTALHSAGKLYNNSVEEGVVRVSMVHYNTVEEVEALVQCLETLL